MPKRSLPRPTNAELDILRVLWERGPSTVRQVHEELTKARRMGYTTALKLMQIMNEKGLVKRDESRRTHIYRPSQSEERTQRQIAENLLEKAFGGSTRKLVMQALSAKEASPEEIAEIRQVLDELEGGSK